MTSMNADLPARSEATEQEVAYTNGIFVQALFPYRKPKDGVDAYRRVVTQGPVQITLTSDNGLPYGKYPRLMMVHIITTAMQRAFLAKTKRISEDEARKIPLGQSFNEFLQRIGSTSRGTGGARGTTTLLKEQFERLITTSITIQDRLFDGNQGAKKNIVAEWNLWNEATGKESYILLTPEFAQLIRENPVPIDLNILFALNKPRSIDLFLWLNVKQCWLERRGQDKYTFSWADIEHQFSAKKLTTPVQRRDFRNEIKECLREINTHWPDSGAEAHTKEGFVLKRTAPSVPMRPSVLKLL